MARAKSKTAKAVCVPVVPKSPRAAVEDPKVYLRPADFLRWLGTQGISISKKNLYETYLGANARHPVKKSADGKRIHKFEALELIRLVQTGDLPGDDDSARIIRERQQAEATYKTGKGQIALIELETLRGERIPRAVIEKVWGAALESFRNSLRSLDHNLPPKLKGLSEPAMRELLETSHHEALKHLAIDFANHGAKP